MRVLCIIHYPVFGGPHNQALLVAQSLERDGIATTVLLPSGSGSAAERMREAGIDVIQMPLHRLRATWRPYEHARLLGTLRRETRAIQEVIRTKSIDVVQISGIVNPHGALAARAARIPVIWQILDTRAPMAVRRLMMPLVLRMADVVMTTGYAVAAAHLGTEKLGERLRVFFPPVDPALFDPETVDREAARLGFGLHPKDQVVGVVGNLNPQKGHEYLLRAISFSRRRRRNIRLLIVGATHDTHGAYERRLHTLSHELGLQVGDDVMFTGPLKDVRGALAAMDVFALASVPRSEGAPTAIEEAMMMKLPVVATDVGAVRELVENGQTGFVVPPRNPAALSQSILRLLDDPSLLTQFGSRAREYALARFSADECARIHRDAYRLALTGSARGPV